jgi:UDP-N-acetyl-D-mannosaminuronate dehydrogenase
MPQKLKFGLGAIKNMCNGINLELIQQNLVAIEATVFVRTTDSLAILRRKSRRRNMEHSF